MDFNVRGEDVCHSEPAETQNDALLSQSLSEHLFKNKKIFLVVYFSVFWSFWWCLILILAFLGRGGGGAILFSQ